MDMVQMIVATVIGLGVLISVHEYGHFWVARRCGVKVLEFSLGFSLGVFKPLWTRTGKDGTRYLIHVVPLGGYVKMLNEQEGPVEPELLARAFNRQPVWRRIAIVVAGPLANFALAILIFYGLFQSGMQGLAPVIGSVLPGSVADAARLEPGQEIVAVDGEATTTQQAVVMRLLARLGESGEIHISARYPGSDLVYESSAHVTGWMQDVDEPDPIEGLGIDFQTPPQEPVIAGVEPGTPAAAAGFKAGDRVISIDGEHVETWTAWQDHIRARAGRSVPVQVERGGETVALEVVPARIRLPSGVEIGRIGVIRPEYPPGTTMPPEMLRTERYGPIDAWYPAVKRTWSLTKFTVDSVRKLLMGWISPKNLSGPITIAKVAGASARSGLEVYIGFLALLSVSLGVLNLLPIPVLDGGHLLFCLIEMVKGSPVSERVQMLGYQVGFAILVGVMVLALFNDISRIAAN